MIIPPGQSDVTILLRKKNDHGQINCENKIIVETLT